MSLSEISDNSNVFIDANIFIYHFTRFEKFANSSLNLFQRIENREISGFTSVIVIAEILHRLMIIEASNKFNLPSKSVIKYLKNNPQKIPLLTDHWISFSFIKNMGIHILPLDANDITQGNDFKKRYRLLTNDSLNLSVIKNHDLMILASNDSDFERVDFITLYKPI